MIFCFLRQNRKQHQNVSFHSCSYNSLDFILSFQKFSWVFLRSSIFFFLLGTNIGSLKQRMKKMTSFKHFFVKIRRFQAFSLEVCGAMLIPGPYFLRLYFH